MRRWVQWSAAIVTVASAAALLQGAPASGTPSALVAHGSVGQLWFSGAAPDAAAVVTGPGGLRRVLHTDANGSLIVRNLPAGSGYSVRVGAGASAAVSQPVTVTTMQQNPPQSFYSSATLHDGYQYITTRDGTQLAAMVRLPGPADQGPYPTVIEYSGYAAADPDNPQPVTLLASTLGYATVAVNIRGTGCSGGAYQYFEPLQSTDGYDAIETVAAQPWVLGHAVGMVGISFSGISQLFAAQTQPPHLAAITPLSVIDDTYSGTLDPGGILNTGFAVGWAKDRQHDGEAAPGGGQAWASRQIAAGDTQCLANQAVRAQMPNVLTMVQQAKWYRPLQMPVNNAFQSAPDLASLSPTTFVDKIDVPVFLAGAFDDEQTGPHFADMLDRFTSSPHRKFTLVNGNHTESLTPEVLVRLYEFLEFYVAHRIPHLPAMLRSIGPAYFSQVFGPIQQFPADRFDQYSSYQAALAAYEAEPSVRVLFENGAGCPAVAIGAPCPTFEASFPSWPIPTTQVQRLFLADHGRLAASAPAAVRVDRWRTSGDGSATTFDPSQGSLWYGLPALHWPSPQHGTALSYLSDPLPATTVMAGTARLDMLLAAHVPDVDVQVTISEVRADGTEMYVQNGWLRASHRVLDPAKSGPLRAAPTHAQADAAPLPKDGSFVPMAIETMPFAHVFHAGSRVRLVIDTPGASRPLWQFAIATAGKSVLVQVAHGGLFPSSIALPIVPGVGASAPAALPPCPSLRGVPCRNYQGFVN